MKLVGRLIRAELKGHYWFLIIVFGITAVISAAPYGFSFLGKWLVDDALQVTGPPKQITSGEADSSVDTPASVWQEKSQEEKLHLLGLFFAISMGIHVVVTGLSALSEYLKSKASQEMTYGLRARMHAKVQGMERGLFQREQVGQLMTRVMDDTGGIPGNLINLVVNFCTQVVMLGLGAYLLFRLNAKMAPIALLALPFYAIACVAFLPRIRKNAEELRVRGAAFNGFVVERLSNVLTIKNYAQEDREVSQFSKILDDNMRLQRSQQKLNLGFGSVTTLITSFGTLAVLTIGFLNIQSGRMQLGETLAFYQITAQLFVPISALVGMTTVSQTLQVIGKRVYDILDAHATLADDSDTVPMPALRGSIAFEDVSLRYEEGGPLAVRDINLSAPAGSTICIVGPTGSGKSTLLTLLARLYDPTEGVIRIDGIDIRELPLADLRLAVANVFRQPVLFSGTILENLTYAAPDVTRTDVEAVAQQVGLNSFIHEQPQGYQTLVGRGGITLETEELVRLSIARALLTKPTILTIDDTYSLVGEETEEALHGALQAALPSRTILITASRLSICKHADLVVVMRAGGIEEAGTHEELLAKPGVYRRMYMRQMGLEEVDLVQAMR